MTSMQRLAWGREYVAVRPTEFRVEYRINPFMDVADQPDPRRAMAQWEGLVAAIERHGGTVDVLDQRPDAPDMVYAMNLGLGVETGPETDQVSGRRARRVVMSHMRHPQRRMETTSAARAFAARGMGVAYVGRDAVGPHFEAGDAFAFGGSLVVGHGPRTEELGLKALATELGIRVRGLRIVHPGMYHLDLAFCPVTPTRAIVCPAAFDDASARALLDLVPEAIVLTEEEALSTFAANSIVVGDTVLMPDCPPRVRERLERWGLGVEILDVSEFHKGGGSIRCLTNPVDVRLGRDLDLVPGGEVVLPA